MKVKICLRVCLISSSLQLMNVLLLCMGKGVEALSENAMSFCSKTFKEAA